MLLLIWAFEAPLVQATFYMNDRFLISVKLSR